MAGVNPDKPNRHARRAAAATASVAPAIDASAERAAIERETVGDGPAITAAPAAPFMPPADLPGEPAAVLPEPTLVAEPGAPQPIVTASPILAAEPSALDVVQADAAAERGKAGIGPAPDREGAHDAAAGQPTLTIKDSVEARAEALRAEILGPGSSMTAASETYPGLDLNMRNGIKVDQLLLDLGNVMRRDPEIFALIRNEVLRLAPEEQVHLGSAFTSAPTVAVVEVVGPAAGRRRAGMTFGPVARHFRADDLTVDQLAALRSDPMLAVGIRDVAEADAPAGAIATG